VNAPNRFIAWPTEADARRLEKRLRDAGFTHVLFVPREWRAWHGLGELSKRGLANWTGLSRVIKADFRGPAARSIPSRPDMQTIVETGSSTCGPGARGLLRADPSSAGRLEVRLARPSVLLRSKTHKVATPSLGA